MRSIAPLKIIVYLSLSAFLALPLSGADENHASDNNSKSIVQIEGVWIYGFEQSILRTCDGEYYWMWVTTPNDGNYQQEGAHNPVRVSGYITKPNRDANMYSPLPTFNMTELSLLESSCTPQSNQHKNDRR